MRNKTIVFTVVVACLSLLLCRAQDSQTDSELAKKAYKTLQEIKFSDKLTIL